MATKIGKQLPDGKVKFISLDDSSDKERIYTLLLNFYKIENKVDELLALGDLISIGATPKQKWCSGDEDYVTCYAEIRDGGKIPNDKILPRCAHNIDIYTRLSEWVLLFEDGCWYELNGSSKLQINWSNIPYFKQEKRKENFTLYRFNKEKKLEKIDKKFTSWEQVCRYVKTSRLPLFVFNNQKLISTFKHTKSHE